MSKGLTLEQQYAGKELPDEQWARILGCDVADIPEFRDYLQSDLKVCIDGGYDALHDLKYNGKYIIRDFRVGHSSDGEVVWMNAADSTILFNDVKSAKKFIYQSWIPDIIFPTKTNTGKPIPERAYLMFRATPHPKGCFVPGRVYSMTPEELALYQKYHGK